jgi:hypothetical protein
MLKNDIILRNPLRHLGFAKEDILDQGGLGIILARAGVGKTALVVQLALNSLIQGTNVLHISLDQPVKKVSLWYKEVFQNLSQKYQISDTEQLWESLLPHRFIMTFRTESFSVATLDERLTDLTEQNVFHPRLIIFDGLPFDAATHAALQDLKAMVLEKKMRSWFTALTHRHEQPAADGLPTQVAGVVNLFDAVVQLQPEGNQIHVRALKGGTQSSQHPGLLLDPATMLVTNE